jgi:hypothetical protein
VYGTDQNILLAWLQPRLESLQMARRREINDIFGRGNILKKTNICADD